jgi:hypothetical protein
MMRLLLTLFALALLSAVALVALAFAVGWPADGIHVIVNDQEIVPAQLGDGHALLALAIAACVIGVVLPLVLALGVLLPLALAAGAVLLVGALIFGAGALALAPLWLPLLLVIWLLRRARRRGAGSGATMAP